MPSLKTINGKPVAEFWREVEEHQAAAVVPPQYPQAPSEAEQQAFLDRVKKLSVNERVEAVREKLLEENPGATDRFEISINDGHVTSFRATDPNQKIVTLWPLQAFPQLRSLEYGYPMREGKLSDLSSLAGLPLQRLTLYKAQASDYSVLKGLPLTYLKIQGGPRDLSFLQGLALEEFILHHSYASDISVLKGMPLKRVTLHSTQQIPDLSPLKGTALEELNLQWSGQLVKDLKGIQVRNLYLENTGISDLTPLKGMPLESLNIGGASVSDLTLLEGMPLKWLSIKYMKVPISSLEPLKKIPTLSELSMSGSGISDLTPLKDLPIAILGIMDNPIHDLSPLRNLPLKQLRVQPRLFDSAEEELLRSLTLEKLGTGRFEQHTSPAVFWKQFEERRAEVIDFAEETSQLPVEEQTAAVLARLRELNTYKSVEEIALESEAGEEAIETVKLTLRKADDDVTPLRAFRQLRELQLAGGTKWLDLSPLNICPLEKLTCDKMIVVRNLPILRAMPSLKTINGEPAAEYLDEVESNPSQTAIEWDDRKVAEWVLGIGGRIHLKPNGVYNQGDALPDAPFNIDKLLLPEKGFDEEELSRLSSIDSLSQLYIGYGYSAGHPAETAVVEKSKGGLADAGMDHVAQLVNLSLLRVQRSNVTDKGIAKLQALHNLSTVTLLNSSISDEGLATLSDLPKLTELSVDGSEATGIFLSEFSNLTHVGVCNIPLTVEGMRAIGKLEQLEFLNACGLSLPDNSLAHWRNLSKLTRLMLINTELTDEDQEHLKHLSSLKSLDLKGSKITPQGIAELQKALPDCKINHDFTAEEIAAASQGLESEEKGETAPEKNEADQR